MIAAIKAGAGAEVEFDDEDVEAEATVDVTYRYTCQGAMTADTSVEFKKEASFEAYEGFIQAYQLTPPGGGSGPWLSMPKTEGVVINGHAYDLTTTPVNVKSGAAPTDLLYYPFASTTWKDSDYPPDRYLQFVKNAGGVKTSGLCIGYHQGEGDGVAATRRTLVTQAGVWAGTKWYPYGIQGGTTQKGSAVAGWLHHLPMPYELFEVSESRRRKSLRFFRGWISCPRLPSKQRRLAGSSKEVYWSEY
jgi:hypothetical protein